MEKLKKGQVIKLEGIEYVVENMIEFIEEKWVWQEYQLCKREEGKRLRLAKILVNN